MDGHSHWRSAPHWLAGNLGRIAGANGSHDFPRVGSGSGMRLTGHEIRHVEGRPGHA